MGLWSTKMYYDCRFFVGNDLWHRCLEMTKIICLATAVWSIRDVHIMSHPNDYPDMFHYCAGVSAAMVVILVRFLEIGWCQWMGREGLYPEAFWVARRDLVWLGTQFLFYVAATAYAATMYFGSDGVEAPTSAVDSSGSMVNATTNETYFGALNGTVSEVISTSSAAADHIPIALCIVGSIFGQLMYTFIVFVLLSPTYRKVPIQRCAYYI
jgi:hypothetical protein